MHRVLVALGLLAVPSICVAQTLPGLSSNGVSQTLNSGDLNVQGTATFKGAETHAGTETHSGATTFRGALTIWAPYSIATGAASPATATSHCAIAAGSTDNDGGITTDGTGSATCAITFGTGFATTAFCEVHQNNAAAIAQTAYPASVSKTGFTATFAAGVANGAWSWHCGGN